MLQASSLHSVEGLLENFEIAGVAGSFARSLDPFLLQRIFGRAIRFVEDAEDAGERELRELIRGEFVGHVVAQFVLGSVVPFLLLDQLEAAAFARVRRIEGAGIKFDTLR